jgi:hypothetical protein
MRRHRDPDSELALDTDSPHRVFTRNNAPATVLRVSADLSALPLLLAAVVAAFSVLGGVMVAYSGFRASRACWSSQPFETLASEINLGIAVGFDWGAPCAFVAFAIVLSSQ